MFLVLLVGQRFVFLVYVSKHTFVWQTKVMYIYQYIITNIIYQSSHWNELD